MCLLGTLPAIIRGLKRTSLHSQRSTNAEDHDEEDEGCETGWRRSVSRVTHSANDNEQHGGSQELRKRIRKPVQSGAWSDPHLIEPR